MASTNSWSSTSCVLAKIEQILSCFICKQLMTEPYLLSSCDHYFCRQCIIGVGTSCPQCNLPVWIKDLVPNYQLTTILCYIKKLISLTTTPINKTSDDITKQSSFVSQLSTHHNTRVPLVSVNCRWTCPTEQRTVKKKRPLDYTKPTKRIKYDDSIKCFDIHSTVNEVPSTSLTNKRNVRGETPLHIAAIKGDENSLTALLCQSADPNVQDHAGWTPLHEACNHGYKTVVEILLNHGALINVPGYNNDTPLHDAVRNGHIHIVRLLVNNGANCCLRNHEGHTPNDLAITDSMKLALVPSPESTVVQVVTPPLSISKHYVIISSGLKSNQRKELYKVAKLLGADVVSEFTQNVTHVITESEGLCCPRTLKCLSAICIGCWLLNYQWLTKSLETGQWANEEGYLIQGFLFQGHGLLTNAPKKCHLNALSKAPRLFDGCEFFFKGLSLNHQPSKNELTKLVQLAGGKVLTREPKPSDENDAIFTTNFCYPFHAPPGSIFTTCHTFIVSVITSSRRINSCLAEVPFDWILDSLSHFKLIEF